MNKKELVEKINSLDALTTEEKSAIIDLLKQKKYGLVWENKPEDVEERLRVELPVLKEVTEKALLDGGDYAPNHILIEGDNLEALTALTYTHENKIDIIYIDPPYNTGKKDEFKYNDRYVDSEDGYRHSKWLSFMNKRLSIAKQLLTKNGLIFVSIDDNEIGPLRMLMDEHFDHTNNPKESNRLATLVWHLGTGTQAGHFTRQHEYVLAYCKNKDLLPNFSGGEGTIDHSALKKISKKNPPVIYTFKAGTKFCAPNGTELFGEWGGSEKTRLVDGRMVCEDGKLKYDVTLEAGFAMIGQMKTWFNGEYTIDSKGQHVLEFYFNSSGVLHYVKDKSIINPPTVMGDMGSTKTGSTELSEIIENASDKFGYPKPLGLISYLLGFSGKNSVILDFFAGSGTTLQTTMQLNAEDGGHRKCILVTNNENNICEEVTYERNKRVINGYTTTKGEEVKGLHNNNLRYYQIDHVERESSLTAKRKLMAASAELLCIKHDIYEESTTFGTLKLKPHIARYFSKGDKKMLIIYMVEAIERIVEEIQAMPEDTNIMVYVFSTNNYAMDADFEDVADKVKLCALPAAIYNAYLKVLPKKGEPKQIIEEDV